MNTVKIHTEDIDPYTEVLALDANEGLSRMQYGELGYPNPYLRVTEIRAALQEFKPRTYEDRFALLEKGYTYYWFAAEGSTGSKHRYCGVSSPEGQSLTGVSHAFETLTEALDYILDMEEQGALAG
jgi:hypothetical protein